MATEFAKSSTVEFATRTSDSESGAGVDAKIDHAEGEGVEIGRARIPHDIRQLRPIACSFAIPEFEFAIGAIVEMKTNCGRNAKKAHSVAGWNRHSRLQCCQLRRALAALDLLVHRIGALERRSSATRSYRPCFR